MSICLTVELISFKTLHSFYLCGYTGIIYIDNVTNRTNDGSLDMRVN